MKIFKVAIRILCLLLAVGIVLTAVFFRDNSVIKANVNADDFIFEEEMPVRNISTGTFEKIAESGFMQLYFNKTTSAISVKDGLTNQVWESVPYGSGADMVSFKVIDKKGVHHLNSYDNSVARSEWSYQLEEYGVKLNYKISEDSLSFNVMVSISLENSNLYVSSKIENSSQDKECAVSDFSVLPYFSAFSKPGANDFLLLPDGCGAVIYPSLSDEKATYCAKVYGDDFSVKTDKSSYALMGAFGIRHGNKAVAVIIDNGEEIATIKAVSDKNSFSRISACFDINDYSINDGKLYISENGYNDKISLCYKFLSGDNASYSEIASSCREQFIRNGSLPSTNVEAHDNVPLYLTFTGVYKKSPWLSVKKEYTTFSQALDILSRIKSKGVDNITVRYKGVLRQNAVSFDGSLGGSKDFKALCDYANSQNIDLFADVNIFTYRSLAGKFDILAAKQMNKSTSTVVVNESPDTVSENFVKYRFRKSSDIRDFVADLIEDHKTQTFKGYCVSDAGLLVSDFSAKYTAKSQIKNTLSSQLPAISNIGQVMVDKGNMYMIKNSSSVINIPMSTYYSETKSYVAIPFAQSVLHGRVVIAAEPVNTKQDVKIAILQCIEYGVCPSFTTVYSSAEDTVVFDKIVNDLIDYYSISSSALKGLEGERITQHTCLKEGVYLTTFSDTAKVYVNYNDSPVTVSGVTIKAQNYLRID